MKIVSNGNHTLLLTKHLDQSGATEAAGLVMVMDGASRRREGKLQRRTRGGGGVFLITDDIKDTFVKMKTSPKGF